jgi:hypothetical protein
MSEISVSEQKKEDWMNSKWRPMMGWMYMIVCICDFVLFPILWSLVQALHGGRVETQWSPITLNGAGLFHMAMGAILGIAAYGRTQEKLNDKAGGTAPTVSAPSTSFTPAPSWGTTPVATTPSGKKVVPDEPQPSI